MSLTFPHIAPIYRDEVGKSRETRVITGQIGYLYKYQWEVSGEYAKWAESGKHLLRNAKSKEVYLAICPRARSF